MKKKKQKHPKIPIEDLKIAGVYLAVLDGIETYILCESKTTSEGITTFTMITLYEKHPVAGKRFKLMTYEVSTLNPRKTELLKYIGDFELRRGFMDFYQKQFEVVFPEIMENF